MKVKRIAILSVLKPVDDTRMYHKIGRSLCNEGYQIHIAGYAGNVTQDKISQYPIFNFPRLSLNRLFAPLKSFFWLIKIKPHLIIVTTHELLFPCVIYKILTGKKLIYDIQENYFLNIRRTNAFPSILGFILSKYVRSKEQILSNFIDHFFLAEVGYQKELPFLKNKFTVLENKAIGPVASVVKEPKTSTPIKLIFTGTIAGTTGIFHCLEMVEKLYSLNREITLQIVGACHIPETLKKLRKSIQGKPYISITGGDKLVPYSEVVKAINSADAGFIFYPDLTLIDNTIPTKLYEYLAHQLPILLQDKKEWLNLAKKYDAAIPISATSFDPELVLKALKSHTFYIKTPGDEVLWDGEAKQMANIIALLLG